MEKQRYEHELIALENIPQGEIIQFYPTLYKDELPYVRMMMRNVLEERPSCIGVAALDLVKDQKCLAIYDGEYKVWPVVSVDESSGRVAIKFSPRE
jgi:hypothetical protein